MGLFLDGIRDFCCLYHRKYEKCFNLSLLLPLSQCRSANKKALMPEKLRQSDMKKDNLSDHERDIVGHWQILVAYYPMHDSYFQLCNSFPRHNSLECTYQLILNL